MTHTAITIGPIYKTLQAVRKTRELWAASYLFSLLSKLLIEEISNTQPGAVYIPYYDSGTPVGIGLYPDRIFIKSDRVTLEHIENAKDAAYAKLAPVIDAATGNSNSLDFISQYFRIYAVQYNVRHDENPVLTGNNLLDSAELRSQWQLEEPVNQLLRFFRQVNAIKVNGSKWINGHLSNEDSDIWGEKRFESLIEIATRPISHLNTVVYKGLVKEYCYNDDAGEVDDREDSFVTELRSALNTNDTRHFKNYHKYVCVVKADGDRVGKYIKAIKGDVEGELGKISKCLYEWGIETNRLIKAYKGATIYVGGDDVLFFAPVVGNNDKSIIQLCDDINKDFQGRFADGKKDESCAVIKPTLSFGISLTYYKFPLIEALAKADDLLRKAKQTRNTICLSLLKHSGASFDIALPFGEGDSVRAAFNLLNPCFSNTATFVNSLIYHIREHEPVYRCLAGDVVKTRNYMKAYFEEEKYEDLIEHTGSLLIVVQHKYGVTPDNADKSKTAMEEVFSMLRMLKFLNGHDDGK